MAPGRSMLPAAASAVAVLVGTSCASASLLDDAMSLVQLAPSIDEGGLDAWGRTRDLKKASSQVNNDVQHWQELRAQQKFQAWARVRYARAPLGEDCPEGWEPIVANRTSCKLAHGVILEQLSAETQDGEEQRPLNPGITSVQAPDHPYGCFFSFLANEVMFNVAHGELNGQDERVCQKSNGKKASRGDLTKLLKAVKSAEVTAKAKLLEQQRQDYYNKMHPARNLEKEADSHSSNVRDPSQPDMLMATVKAMKSVVSDAMDEAVERTHESQIASKMKAEISHLTQAIYMPPSQKVTSMVGSSAHTSARILKGDEDEDASVEPIATPAPAPMIMRSPIGVTVGHSFPTGMTVIGGDDD